MEEKGHDPVEEVIMCRVHINSCLILLEQANNMFAFHQFVENIKTFC